MPTRTTAATAAALAALALAGSACFDTSAGVEEVAIAQPEMPPPPELVDPPMGAPEPGPGGGPDGGGDGAQQVSRNPDIENPSPVPWERVAWDKASQSLTVYWTSGVEPCTQLFDVVVEVGDDVLVTVLEGAPPEAATISCVMMAQAKQFTVQLDEDVSGKRFVSGAR